VNVPGRPAAWSEATAENVLERYGVDDAATVFQALVRNRVFHVPGVNAESSPSS
jgi:hypothetical protein